MKTNAEDYAEGWRKRVMALKVKKPEEHFMVVNGVRHDIQSILCDDCGTMIEDRSEAFAVTLFRECDGEPALWETEFLSL